MDRSLEYPRDSKSEDREGRLLSRTGVQALMERIQSLAKGGGSTEIFMRGWWKGELRWARNRVSMAGDRRDCVLVITRKINGARGMVGMNQLDDDSLLKAIRGAERNLRFQTARANRSRMRDIDPNLPYPSPAIWSDATFNITAEQRGIVARALIKNSEQTKMLSAGYIEMMAAEVLQTEFGDEFSRPEAAKNTVNGVWTIREQHFTQYTQSECSMTARAPNGSGSGWAGLSSYDWNAIDGTTLAQHALDKCVASLNARTIEPGRYTVILEPQAVADIMEPFIQSLRRYPAERGQGPWALGFDNSIKMWRTRLGLKIADDRITIRHDPMDPQLGVLPQAGLRATTFVLNGVLQALAYERDHYALPYLNENLPETYRTSYRMDGGTATVEQMIAGTKRGIVVTRFWGINTLDGQSLLSTGVTRDGLWLVEKGRITQAIRNMRFTDSPLFVLNQVEQLGPPVPVYHADQWGFDLSPVVVPPIKANDFAFTSTIDAV